MIYKKLAKKISPFILPKFSKISEKHQFDPQKAHLEVLMHNCKQFGRDLAKHYYDETLLADEPSNSKNTEPFKILSKPCTMEDLKHPFFSRWCSELKLAPLLHRKLWEYAYVLEVLEQYGMLKEGKRGLGFACGEEELPSFLASKGVHVLATDLEPDKVASMGWAETGQHTKNVEMLYRPEIISRKDFDERVSLQYVDMNDIPDDFKEQFDFCWSICSYEHLGSIQNGIDFIVNSSKTLKPGGCLVHTTEFNLWSNDQTIDNQPTVLFRQQDFEKMKILLEEQGLKVATLSFDAGDDPMDQYIDIPPYAALGLETINYPQDRNFNLWTFFSKKETPPHLKMSIDGFPSTCFGIVAKKNF